MRIHNAQNEKQKNMENSNIKKALKKAQEMLTVINSQTLKGKDSDLLIWKNLNEAIKLIEDSRVILHKNK